jgi:prolyl oligopeptidase
MAPVRPVVDTYFGTAITDPYRWMENLEDPETKAWMKAENDYTRAVLASLPGRTAYLKEIVAMDAAPTRIGTVQLAAPRIFFRQLAAGEQTIRLLVHDPRTQASRVIFDPNPTNDPNVNANLNMYTPDWNGARVAVLIASSGSENATLRVIDGTTGHTLVDEIDRARFAIPAWLPDGSGFFYTRLPKLGTAELTAQNENNARVFLHMVGTDPKADRLLFGGGVTPGIIPEDIPVTFSSPTSHYAVTLNVNGTASFGGFCVARISDIRAGHPRWRSLGDAVIDTSMGDPGTFGFITATLHGDDLYALRLDAQQRTELVRLPLGGTSTLGQAKVLIPAADSVIDNVASASDALYVKISSAGVSRLIRLPYTDNVPRTVALRIAGSVSTLLSTDPRKPGVVFGIDSWTRERAYYAYHPASDAVMAETFKPKPAMDTSEFTAEEVTAVSADGTRVPLSIVHMRGMPLDGSHPTQLYGYGAYGISLTPNFDPTELPWLRRGGVLATAHVRGGGEFGEPWHLAGKGANRQHSVDDFIACAQYLIAKKYTSAKRLAAVGRSAGGTLIGNAFVQHPELFAAVLDEVGVSDLLRGEQGPNGPAQIPETGSVKTADGFKSMFAVSPYQHVMDGARYPAVLLTTGINDPRVPPWMVVKMAARLQAATTSGRPILLRVDYNGGHMGETTSQFDEEQADEESFLLWQFGDPAFQP